MVKHFSFYRIFSSWAPSSAMMIAYFNPVAFGDEVKMIRQISTIDVEGRPISLVPGVRSILSGNNHKYKSDIVLERPLTMVDSDNASVKVIKLRDWGAFRAHSTCGMTRQCGLSQGEQGPKETFL